MSPPYPTDKVGGSNPMKLQYLVILVLMFFLVNPLFAATIVGTEEELNCVYSHRDALSLGRLVDPVPIYVPSCPENYADDVAMDYTHGTIETVKPIPHSEDIPPVADWPKIRSCRAGPDQMSP